MVPDIKMRTAICRTCGVVHAYPEVLWEEKEESGGYIFCPNGHQWGFREGRKERDAVHRERDLLKQQTARLEDELREAAARAAKAEAESKRIMTRTGAGVCPCCNRSFAQLARHMKAKHPDVVPLKQKSI
jgi:hypothetical protein